MIRAKSLILIILFLLVVSMAAEAEKIFCDKAFNDNAEDTRMNWWREARFGMFIHWGIYAVPA